MTTVARLLGDRLRSAGIRYVFGHPGGEVVDLIEGLRAAGLEFVLTRHETSAAFMADAIATASGVPAACVATLGPGATNLVTGVAQAYLDRSPVIALVGQLPADRYEITTHQKLDLRALYAPITKWQARLTARNAAAAIERALRVALRPRRGPVLLEVPSDVPRQDALSTDGDPERSDAEALGGVDGGTGAVDRRAIDATLERLRASRRPVLLAGMDALDDRVVDPLRRLAEAWRIPVISSPKGKGTFRDDSPLHLGTIEGLGTAKLFDFVDGCDLVLMVGFDPVELDRDWSAPAPVVHIGPLPNDDRNYRSAVEIVGPLHASLERLAAAAGTPAHDLRELRDFRERFRAYVAPARAGLTAQQVLAELRTALPEDALVTCDVGHNKAVATQCWPAYRPRTFFVSNGLSSMGYGLPAALGLKLLHRDRAVACVLGDGGFGMLIAELETAVRLGLGVTVVVLADEALSQIKAGQERKGYPVTGTTFGAIDYVTLAKAFGIEAVEARTVEQCREAFSTAPRDRPRLVAAHVDPEGYRLD